MHRLFAVAVIAVMIMIPAQAQELIPGKTIESALDQKTLPPTLYSQITGTAHDPAISIYLPPDYSPSRTYPLLVYVPGNHGGPAGNCNNAIAIANGREWIAVSLPLFKQAVDPNEMGGGLIIGFADYPVLSAAYRVLLEKVYELVPNTDPGQSAMVGFSNGALAIAVLVSNHDEFILSRFRSFCLVDHGMFHLTDLHKALSRKCRYLLLIGEKDDPGRELKISQTRLLRQVWTLINIDFETGLLTDTGHAFNRVHMEFVGDWISGGVSFTENSLSHVVKPLR